MGIGQQDPALPKWRRTLHPIALLTIPAVALLKLDAWIDRFRR